MRQDWVRDPVTGDVLPCCWADCERPGHDGIRIVKHEGPLRTLTYVFCSERHRQLYANSHIAYGDLPLGSRNRNGLL